MSLFLETNIIDKKTIKIQLKELDENYSREDRKVNFAIYKLTSNPAQLYGSTYDEKNKSLKISETARNLQKALQEYWNEQRPTINKSQLCFERLEEWNQIQGNRKITYYELRHWMEDLKKIEDLPWNLWGQDKSMYLLYYETSKDIQNVESFLDLTSPKIEESKVYIIQLENELSKGTYQIEAKIYYSYTSMDQIQDINLATKETKRIIKEFLGTKTAIKFGTINNPYNASFRSGNLFLYENKLHPIKELLTENYETLNNQIKELVNQYKNQKISYGKLREQILRKAYSGLYEIYAYYPYYSIDKILHGSENELKLEFTNIIQEFPLVKTVIQNLEIDGVLGTEGETNSGNINALPEEMKQNLFNPTIVPSISYSPDWLVPDNNIVINPTAGTQYKALFPPILESYQPAFVGEEISEYEIFFRLSDYTNIEEVAHIDLRVTLQANNTSVVNSAFWTDQIIYKIKSKNDFINHGNGLYSVKITTNILNDSNNYDLVSGHWQNNTYYKVQARLGTSWSGWNNTEEYITWRNNQINQGRFSEWSTVMILKSIPRPIVSIENNRKENNIFAKLNTPIEANTTPLFYGKYDQNNLGGNEFLDTYQFILYNENNEILEDSGILQYNNNMNREDSVIVSYRFNKDLIEGQKYKVLFKINTVNGYKTSSDYIFSTALLTQEYNFTLSTESEEENGIIKIFINPKSIENTSEYEKVFGSYIITRTEEGQNNWEDLAIIKIETKETDKQELVYIDYTPQSGIQYIYGIQRLRENDYRDQRLMSEVSWVNFEHIFLYANGQQLKLNYNTNINSLKHTVLETKQDTLGGRYPYVSRNGFSYYAEFPFEALISFNSDDMGYFLVENNNDNVIEENWKRENNTIINKNYIYNKENKNKATFSTDLTYDNIIKERYYREQVEKFLNNGELKLFRSGTEGNFIVRLMNINFSPEAKLGRMIYSVSGTAYEMAENSLKNLKFYNILPMGKYNNIFEKNKKIFGQIAGFFTEENDIIEIITKDIKKNNKKITDFVPENFKITELSFQPFPKINLNNQIYVEYIKEQKIQPLENIVSKDGYVNGALTVNENGELQYYNNKDWSSLSIEENLSYSNLSNIDTALNDMNTYFPSSFKLNGKTIVFTPDTPYVLQDQNFTLSDKIYIQKIRNKTEYEVNDLYQPVLINYCAEYDFREKENNIIKEAYIKKGYEQMNGYFYKKNQNHHFLSNDINNNIQIITKGNGITYYNNLNVIENIKQKILQDIKKQYSFSEKISWNNNKLLLSETQSITLEEITNLVIILPNKGKILVNNEEKECDSMGIVFSENQINSNIEFIGYEVYATVFYDYKLSFIEYIKQEGDNNEF